MSITSSGNLMDTLRQHLLLTPAQATELPHLVQGRSGDARSLAKALIQKGWLSVYQVNQLLMGRADELVIGPYRVLEKLGQGGLSTVFKAQHREHRNLVAIKIIRPEVFASTDGRQAFLQEVEAMARLDHANIVQFCDADQWNDTYYFAMEYVEGTDLGKAVRLSGALPVQEACDYIRQTALGLQHAHERNLIHRDIKPVNLFLTQAPVDLQQTVAALFATRRERNAPGPVGSKATLMTRPTIKILDWGLANQRSPGGLQPEAPGEADRGVVGTADYLSPEQARDARAADIRSDIYSLGCTLYYLLTGQPPFPDGTLVQKLMQHQSAQPRPIAEFRADVPASVAAAVERMMAKHPDDRFQTPASVALAFLSFVRQSPSLAGKATPRLTMHGVPIPSRDDTPLPSALTDKPKPGDSKQP
ncbi:MAG: serine/threonine protein kinase [Planctomycetes bacterium]|nr:serine/threonine protein kinase [Planctomycetota bacterium]